MIVLAVTQNVVVPLGGSGRFINMSAFDLVVPLCVLAVWWMRGLHQPPYMILLGLGLAVVLALGRGAVTYLWAESVQPAGLARGTVKMVAVCFLVAALLTLFGARKLREPPA